MENKMEKQEDIFLPEFKEQRMDIFDRRFPATFDDPIYDPTKMTIIQGTDGVLDDLFSYQVYNKLKNHWRLGVAPADIQPGMIWSDLDDDKLYHHGAADEEILQLTRSSDVSPYFFNLNLAAYIYHTGDVDTYIRFQGNHITLRAGGIDFIDMVEAATDYLQLLTGLNFIGDNVNTEMTQGLTINQAGYDDDILAFKSSDVAHGITDVAETDTYGDFRKDLGDEGGLAIRGFGESFYSIDLQAFYTTDNTTKSTGGRAPFEFVAYKKVGTGVGAQGADANILAIRTNASTRWIVDEDGDTWQVGAMHRLALHTATELTIAAGVITVTKSSHSVDTQDDDAADDLNTINGGIDGQILVLRQEDNARNVTVKDAADNIQLNGDCLFGTTTRKLWLYYDGNETTWIEIHRF